MDKGGRILIRADERKILGLKVGTEFEIVRKGDVLILKPTFVDPLQVDGSHRKWSKEAFLDAREATFGD